MQPSETGAIAAPQRYAADAGARLITAGHGLDWLNLSVANVQTGFGPFIAVYLTTQGWTQTAIGTALSLGTVVAMASQIPAGALVDAVHSKARIAAASILVFTLSALLIAAVPLPLFVYLAEILHGFSSCTLGPAIAAMSLAIAGSGMLGIRLGRNARYASIGNSIGAVMMGACGFFLSGRWVFFLTAALTLPALAALVPLARVEHRPPAHALASQPERLPTRILQILADRRLLVFAACVALFTFGNAAMLPLVSVVLTKSAHHEASLYIAAGIVLPQLIVVLISPSIGRLAEVRGRRLILIIGLCALPARGVLFALLATPALMVAVQALDGLAGASFGVLVPLIASDVAGRSGHYNLSLGFLGVAIGIGATLSTIVAGWIADRFGDPAAFIGLGVVGLAALLLAACAMPETALGDR
jgi:MFS family permease